MGRRRARNGTRWMSGRLFVLRSVHEDKEYARSIADKVREGETACGCGCPRGTEHFARVVKRNYHDRTYERDDGTELDLNRWAVFAFRKN